MMILLPPPCKVLRWTLFIPHRKKMVPMIATASTVQETEIHYPSGLILVLIVSGLFLSIFLVALDIVSSSIRSQRSVTHQPIPFSEPGA